MTVGWAGRDLVWYLSEVEDLRCMAEINERLIDDALKVHSGSRDEHGMAVLRFSDDIIRDLIFASYDLRRRAALLADNVAIIQEAQKHGAC